MEILDLTLAEQRAIRQLKEVAAKWPPTLWLFSGSGSLCVMRRGADGKKAMCLDGEGDEVVNQNYIVATIDIPNDGGDW